MADPTLTVTNPTPGVGMEEPATLESAGVKGSLQRKAWLRSQIFAESLTGDVMTGNAHFIEAIMPENAKEQITLSSNKSVIRISPKTKDVDEGCASVTLALQLSLQGAAVNGDAQYIGTEEEARWKSVTAYANDYARPLASFKFGIHKLDQDWLGLDKNKRTLLSQWLGETRGLHYRQAYNENVSENLTDSPVSRPSGINSNIIFADAAAVAGAGRVPYSSTIATYQANILAASTAATPASNHLTVPRLLDIGDIASQDVYMKPMQIMGKKLYVLYTSAEEIRIMRNAKASGSYAESFLQAAAFAKVAEILPEAEMVIGNIILCLDERASTMKGDSTFGYKLQGRGSSRMAAAADVYNVNVLVGAESLIEYQREMVNFNEQKDDYERFLGTLIRENSGCTLPNFNLDTETDTSIQNEGSMLLLTSREQNIGG